MPPFLFCPEPDHAMEKYSPGTIHNGESSMSLGVKLIGLPNIDMLAAINQLAIQSRLPGFLYGFWDAQDYHVETYFSDCTVECLQVRQQLAAIAA